MASLSDALPAEQAVVFVCMEFDYSKAPMSVRKPPAQFLGRLKSNRQREALGHILRYVTTYTFVFWIAGNIHLERLQVRGSPKVQYLQDSIMLTPKSNVWKETPCK